MRVAVPLEQCWHEVPGGTARASIDLVSALTSAGVEVVGVAARHRDLPPAPWTPPVPVRQLPLPRPVLYETWHGLRRPVVERATGPVDVVHVVGGAVAGHRAPLLVTVHDLAFRHHPGMFTRHGRRFFERALALAAREAELVLTPSLATLEDCVAAGIARDRVRHVPWGIDRRPPPETAVSAVRERFGLRRGYVVVVGTLEPRKNLRRLLEAWERIDADLDLVVVGPTGWGDAVDRPDPGSGSGRNVSMIGFVDDATRDALYAGAVASAYPSLMEGFGLPVLESMAMGCPVVTSWGTATEELVAGGAGIAVDPYDVGAIADALASVIVDEGLQARLREAGLRRAAELTWESTAQATIAAYEAVAG